nr:DUF11 domain-containing protein [Pedobacter sp. ASV2]
MFYNKNKPLHKFYNFKKLIGNPTLYIALITLSFLLTSTKVCAQKNDVPLTLRTSQQAPGDFAGKQIYTLKGDFTMLGNANSKVIGSFRDFLKLPNEPADIVNSSSATFDLPPSLNNTCTKIIFAGLYWTGEISTWTTTMNVKSVKFKTPAMNAYTDIYTRKDIFYSDAYGPQYVGYCDVTKLVQTAGVGTYSVANIAGIDHTYNNFLNPAGWSLVVIYENATLPLKNIGVFDGFISSIISPYKQIDFSGFRTNQVGHVNIKLGLMAMGGTRNSNIGSIDKFSISKRNQTNLETDWYPLSHSLNSPDDFFNGSILTGGNTRIPNNTDNDVDIVVFNVPNENNIIMDNNQTSTSFLAHSNVEGYYLCNVTFAFDAYAPLITAFNKSNSNLQNNASVSPGQNLDFEVDLYNKGNEAIKNTAVEITLPKNVTFVSSEFTKGGNVISLPPDVSNLATNGKVKWTIGNLEVPRDIATIIGKLKYTVKVTDDCLLITTGATNCSKTIAINGKIVGTGAVSGADFDDKLVIGYTAGACAEAPIYDAFSLNLNASDAFIASCPGAAILSLKTFTGCGTNLPFANVASSYPAGTKFYSTIPSTTGYETSIINDNFSIDQSGKLINYYAILPGGLTNCFLNLQTQYGNCYMMSNPMIPAKFKTQ